MLHKMPFKNSFTFIALSVLLVCLTASSSLAQSGGGVKAAAAPKAEDAEKAEQILQRATEALGGNAYLNVRSITAHGLYTLYKEGKPELPLSFTDYIVLPDKERTEFKGQGVKSVQTNTGESGWVFDGMTKNIKDMKAAQIADFKLA
ncbi:MAG: hypothetical protein JOZ52_11120, partial [Acidobacteria bacterium]|nr:hypothetical protein [Acidobacteriota bacterium]